MDFIKYANNVKQEMINDLCELLKIDTVLVEQPEVKEAPFGYNMVKALNYMLDLGKKMGFNVDYIKIFFFIIKILVFLAVVSLIIIAI